MGPWYLLDCFGFFCLTHSESVYYFIRGKSFINMGPLIFVSLFKLLRSGTQISPISPNSPFHTFHSFHWFHHSPISPNSLISPNSPFHTFQPFHWFHHSLCKLGGGEVYAILPFQIYLFRTRRINISPISLISQLTHFTEFTILYISPISLISPLTHFRANQIISCISLLYSDSILCRMIRLIQIWFTFS